MELLVRSSTVRYEGHIEKPSVSKLVCFVLPLTVPVLCSCERIFQPLHCSDRLWVVGRQTGQIYYKDRQRGSGQLQFYDHR